MSLVWQPSKYDSTYQPARGPVLLLTCMDLRLLDEIVEFMDHDGQTNRYDHVILAGAALGATGANGLFKHWECTFEEHLEIAYQLHQIKDVYILEHRDCGAYQAFLDPTELKSQSKKDRDPEARCHKYYVRELSRKIKKWAKNTNREITVTSFLMDLRGRVDLLTSPEHYKKAKEDRPKIESRCDCRPKSKKKPKR